MTYILSLIAAYIAGIATVVVPLAWPEKTTGE